MRMRLPLIGTVLHSVSFVIDSFEDQRVEKIIVGRIWRNRSCSLSGSRDMVV